MRLIRSLIAFTVPALSGILLLLLLMPFGPRQARNVTTRLVGAWGCGLAGIKLHVDDPHESRKQRPAVFVFNHQSGVDPVLLCAVLRGDVIGIAKSQWRRHPLLGPLLALAGTVFVERDAGRGSADLEPARQALARGTGVVIAPEGHRSRTLHPFRPGALSLARQAGVPIVPVIIEGAGAILPPGAFLMRPGEVNVTLGPALPPDSISLQALEDRFRAHFAVA